ncbi:carbon-nitrogen hydrolase family protein [bacterium]|nr:carbon-nitrogen hydrolase family protein [bacterium]
MPRRVWVSTTSFQRRGGPTVQDNLRRADRLIDIAAQDRPDIICLPELFGSLWVPHDRAAEVAEPVPGPTTDLAAGKAKKYGTYIICPLYEKRGDEVYNSAAVIDRQGQIVGVYEKRHPVTSSFDFTQFESGVTPGQEVKVFDLDFGRIGILICFDIGWPQDWARLKEMGAEIVFWPSAADGGFALQAFAWLHHYYVVSAVTSAHAYVIDITGEVLLKTGIRASVGGMEIDLEKRFFHTDFNASQIPAIREKYGRDVAIRVYHEEGGMTVQSNRPGLSVQDLMAEFDLELPEDYFARHDRAEVFTRAGRTPEPQPPRRTRAKSFTF